MLGITKDLIALNGGFSIDRNGNKPLNGFMVSPFKERETVIDFNAFNDSIIESFLNANTDIFTDNAYIGGWLENNQLYLDISLNITDIDTAEKIARENSQLAIYDVLKGESISITA